MTEQPQQQLGRQVWLSIKEFAQLAGIAERRAQNAAGRAQEDKTWRGARLVVRQVQGVGGAAGKQKQILLSSTPIQLQVRWHRQQPHADLRELVVEHAAYIEEERSTGARKNRERFNNKPWTQEEREARHAEFSRMATSIQVEARRQFEIVRLFRSFDGSNISTRECYAVAAREADGSVSTIRRWVGRCRNLHQGDWLAALAPKHRGWQLAPEISPDAHDWIKTEYFKLSKPSLKPIYRRAERMAQGQSWTLPAYDTVKRLIQAEPYWYHVLMREGREAAALLCPAQERDYSTLKLHEIWCADGRMSDVFARWEDGSVSRPILVAWVDVRSRVCLGWEIGKTESADLIRLAFKAAAEHSHALPEAALIDNGRAFASKLMTGGTPNRYRFKVREEDVPGILTLLGIEVSWTLPYSGRSKPIESWWRTIAEMDRRFPGAYCGNKPDARPEDCDPRKAVPIAQYREILAQTIAEYHAKPHRGDAMDERSPHEIYETLLAQTFVRSPSPEQLRLCMLAAEVVRLDPADGCVRILGNRYWHAKLAELPRHVNYVGRFDPEDARQPVALYRGEEFLCDVPLVERTGFRDQQAAKDSARASRRFLKGLKEQAGAVKDMSEAAAWMAAPGGGSDADPVRDAAAAALPVPKLVFPVRPEKDYRPAAKEKSSISREEFMRVVTAESARRRKSG